MKLQPIKFVNMDFHSLVATINYNISDKLRISSLYVLLSDHNTTNIMLFACMKYVTGPGKTGLIYKNTLVYIMACIFCSVFAIQNLLVLLNSSWISAYIMIF